MDKELKKINIETTDSLNKSSKQFMKPKKKSKGVLMLMGIVFLPLLVILIAGMVLAVLLMPLKDVYAKAQILAQTGKEVAQAAKAQDLEKTKQGLQTLRVQLTDVQNEYKRILYLKQLPYLGAYISDGEHGMTAAFAGLSAADRAIEAIEPNADLLGLKGGSKFVSGSADERIQTAVKTMKALTPKVNEMAVHIDTLRKEIDNIDPSRYPEEFRGIKIRSQMVLVKELIDNTASLFVNAQPLIMNLPKILGEPDEKRYLVLFHNDKELRPTGGFLTAYGQFRIVKGKMILEKADDIYALDASLQKKFAAPKEILTYHKGVTQLNIRDSNLSPDFKISMKQFEEMYNTAAGREKVDGILAVDTHVLVEMLKILGPIYVYGREFSAEIDKRCDCPRAVYELEDYSSRPVGYIRENRKDIIGVLLQQVMQMALGVSPSKYWGRLFQVLIDEINQKHIFAYFKDVETQKAVESFNMAGRIMTSEETAPILKYQEGKEWDYLHISNANMAGQKANMFVNQNYTKDVTINSDGTISTKLTLEYRNPYEGSDCNLERGGLCLNAPLRNWIRVYVPNGSKLQSSIGTISPQTGQAQTMETKEELGKTVFEGFTIVNPKGNAKVELTYTSPVKLDAGKYRLLWQKQGGTNGDEILIRLNGKDKKKMVLEGDTEVVL